MSRRFSSRFLLSLTLLTLCLASSALAQESELTERQAQELLWDSAKSGDVESIHRALEAGADIQAIDHRGSQSGRRPLNWAAWHNHPEAIIELIRHGVDLDAVNTTGFTPIHHAAENGSHEAAQVLIWAGADINFASLAGENPLDRAVREGYTEIAALLRAAGAHSSSVQ